MAGWRWTEHDAEPASAWPLVEVRAHQAAHPVDEVFDVKVQEKSRRAACQLEIAQRLRLVNGREFLHGFDFDYHEALDHQIDFEIVDRLSSVGKRNPKPPLHAQAARRQFDGQAAGIDGLEEPRPHDAMDLDSACNDAPCQIFEFGWIAVHADREGNSSASRISQ